MTKPNKSHFVCIAGAGNFLYLCGIDTLGKYVCVC